AGFLKKSGGSVELYGAIVSAASNMENPGAVLKDLSAIRHETFHNELLKSFKSFKDKAAAREILFSSAGKLSGEYDISLLIFIDENRFTEAAGVLLQLLGGRTAQIREYAARLLKDFGTPDIHEAVIERISFETSAFTGEDAGFLKLLLDILAIQGTADSQSTIISTMKFAELSEHACSKLLEIGESGIPYLALALKAKDTERSGAAMKCLRRYGGAAVGEASKLLTHPSEDVRLFALSFVSENGGVEIIPELVRLYDEGKPFPKDKILDLLSNFEVRHYEGIVDELLNSDQTDERIKGLSLLEKRCETGYRKKIISMLEDDEEASIREKAAAVIFHAGLDEAVPVMERMAQYEEENFALNLVHYLGFMGGADTADVLMGLRKGKSAKLGEAAGLA
ncbi:MAG: HEAT repeat domain-containing protein, partial [Deltaproteobacteria bacterium]|nr:HEAT repeat domain-containing protein [Deltaproteobacteria bacterium]